MSNTNTQPKVFEWTDELVKEFIYNSISPSHEIHQELNKFMNRFIKEKQQPIEDRIVVNTLDYYGNCYFFTLNHGDIPKEKHEAIKQAIEGVLNNEMPKNFGMFIPSGAVTNPDGSLKLADPDLKIPTIERQEQDYSETEQQQIERWIEENKKQDTKEDNPDWEIISYKEDGVIYKKTNDGWFHGLNGYKEISNKSEIYSVRRKSDNEVFTVGDWVKETITGKCEGWAIKEFTTKDTRCFAEGVNILNIEKAPKEEQKPVPFEKELEHLINKHSMENGSDTPDYILAKYLSNCLEVYNDAVTARDISKI